MSRPQKSCPPAVPSVRLDLSTVRPLCLVQCQAADTLTPRLSTITSFKSPSSSPLQSPNIGRHPWPRASAHLTRANIHLKPDSLSRPTDPSIICPLCSLAAGLPSSPSTILNRTFPWLLEATNSFTWRGDSSICQMHLPGIRVSLSWLNNRHQRSSGQPAGRSLFWEHFPSK